jgi:hypothetical protein
MYRVWTLADSNAELHHLCWPDCPLSKYDGAPAPSAASYSPEATWRCSALCTLADCAHCAAVVLPAVPRLGAPAGPGHREIRPVCSRQDRPGASPQPGTGRQRQTCSLQSGAPCTAVWLCKRGAPDLANVQSHFSREKAVIFPCTEPCTAQCPVLPSALYCPVPCTALCLSAPCGAAQGCIEAPEGSSPPGR